MALTAAAIDAILDQVVSRACEVWDFSRVQAHEPKSAPGVGLTLATFVQQFQPIALASGLDATSARMELVVRLYRPFVSQPEDLIDPDLAKAATAICLAYSGDFDLGGQVRDVDLLGQFGVGLGWRAGYQTIDRTVYRIVDITVPLILNDVFPQVA